MPVWLLRASNKTLAHRLFRKCTSACRSLPCSRGSVEPGHFSVFLGLTHLESLLISWWGTLNMDPRTRTGKHSASHVDLAQTVWALEIQILEWVSLAVKKPESHKNTQSVSNYTLYTNDTLQAHTDSTECTLEEHRVKDPLGLQASI